MNTFTVNHDLGRHVSVAVGNTELARYVYSPQMPEVESRKPYIHPIHTLRGALVSAFRPWDHPWHKGIQMTWSEISGENFWGGKTYVEGEYLWKKNVGRIQHRDFRRLEVTDTDVRIDETLDWITATGEMCVAESRSLTFHSVDADAGVWMLDFSTTLENARETDLEFGSPTTLGRPNAGYTGLFWRGPRSWTNGIVTAADGGEGPEMMGRQARWLAISGRNDEVDGSATVLFTSGQTSSDVPIKWFVRNEPFAAINPSPAFNDVITVAPGDSLTLRHGVAVIDSSPDRDALEAAAKRLSAPARISSHGGL